MFVSMFQHGSRGHQNTQCRVGRTLILLIDLSIHRHRKLWLQIFQNLDVRYIKPAPRRKQCRWVPLECLKSKWMAASMMMNRTMQVILVIENDWSFVQFSVLSCSCIQWFFLFFFSFQRFVMFLRKQTQSSSISNWLFTAEIHFSSRLARINSVLTLFYRKVSSKL